MDEPNKSSHHENVMRLSLFPEILGGLSHELAQPLNAITLACEVMRLKIERSSLSSEEKDFFDVRLQGVKTQVTKAGSLIDNLRFFFNEHSTDSTTTDVPKALERVTGLVGQQFMARGIKLSVKSASGGFPSTWPRQIVEIAIGQCLVCSRKRLETIKKYYEALGTGVNCELTVEMRPQESGGVIEFSWDRELDRSIPDESGSCKLQDGIEATRLTVTKLGGDLRFDTGLISLMLK